MEFLTVVYLEEVPQLEVQLSSLALTTDPAEIGTFTIVVNETDPSRLARCRAAVEALVDEILVDETGRAFAERIRVVDLHDCISPATEAGYVNQQIVKVVHAARSPADFCIVLDAKNCALRGVRRSSHFAQDGRATIAVETYTDHYQRYMIDYFYDFFGVAPERRLYALPSMMTPFALNAALCRALIARCEEASGLSFSAFFAGREHFSEFLLYATFLVARDIPIESLYAVVPQACLTLWPEMPSDAASLRNLFATIDATHYGYLGVHRRKLLALDAAERTEFLAFLQARGLRRRHLEALFATLPA